MEVRVTIYEINQFTFSQLTAPVTTGYCLAESHLTGRLFGAMLGKAAALPSPAG